MTKKAGGQSLLISGALKMSRGKRPPHNNIAKLDHNHTHRDQLTSIVESHNSTSATRELQVDMAGHHDIECASNSSTDSLSDFTSSPLQQDHKSIKTITSQQRQQLTKMTATSNSSASSPAPATDATGAIATTSQHKQNNLQVEGKNKKLFPQKLWDLINDERYSFCLRWSDDGQLVYLNRDEFEDSYLKTAENQFHTQKAISFVRQMNMYGFRKVDDCYYENDNFKRGCEHLLKNMTRKHPNKTIPGLASHHHHQHHQHHHHQQNGTQHNSDMSNFLHYKSLNMGAHQHAQMPNFLHQVPPATNPKVAHRQSAQSLLLQPDLQQPVDLRCAMQQASCSGVASLDLQAAANNNQNGQQQQQQDLNRLIESLVAISQANLLEASLRQHQEEQERRAALMMNQNYDAAMALAAVQAGAQATEAELDMAEQMRVLFTVVQAVHVLGVQAASQQN